MNGTSKIGTAAILITGLAIISYFAGYAVLRSRCHSMGNGWHIVPSNSPNVSDPMVKMYMPLFYLETRMTGREFMTSPWGGPGYGIYR